MAVRRTAGSNQDLLHDRCEIVNLIIIDDPIKPQDALPPVKRQAVNHWFDGTLYSRLDDKRRDVIVLIMQRVHMDDLLAHMCAKEDWVHLNLPAIVEVPECFRLDDGRVFTRAPGTVLHPAREPIEVLGQARANLGADFFEAQYQQNPVPERGNLVSWDWFRFYDTIPMGDIADGRIVQSWDTAMTAHDGSD